MYREDPAMTSAFDHICRSQLIRAVTVGFQLSKWLCELDKVKHPSVLKTLYAFGFVALASIGFLLASPAQAAVTKWNCGCTPEELYGECKCTGYEFQLKKSGTREFQARCTQETTPLNQDVYPQFVEVRRDNGVTCTKGFPVPPFPGTLRYQSKSCTNWSAIKKNTVHMAIRCYAQ